MKNLLLAFFLLLSMYAQSQCKYKVNEFDAFTKVQKKVTDDKKIFLDILVAEQIKIAFRKIDDQHFADIEVIMQRLFSVTEGSEFLIMLPDQSIIKLTASKSVVPQFYKQYTANIPYSISKEDLTKLTNTPIAKFRVYYSDSYKDYNVSKGNAAQLQKIAYCITQ